MQVADGASGAVGKQPCPYDGCRSLIVWFWGWFDRKGGSIPCEGDGVSGPIRIRRFYCSKCGRTFSWRPRVLVFGRRFAAAAYQQIFKAWALGRRLCRRTDETSWYLPDASTCKAFRRQLSERAEELLCRLRAELPPEVLPLALQQGPLAERVLRRQLWDVARALVRRLAGAKDGRRFSCHFICMALARHRSGTAYSLESA